MLPWLPYVKKKHNFIHKKDIKNVDLIELSCYKSGEMLLWIPINIKLGHDSAKSCEMFLLLPLHINGEINLFT